MGVPAGPKIGEILTSLHQVKLNGEVRTRQDEEKLVNHLR
jgi:hypothetical protein